MSSRVAGGRINRGANKRGSVVERKFRITVDGHAYVVTVEELGDGQNRLYPEPGSMRAAAQAAPVAAATAAAPPPGAATSSASCGPGDVVATLGGVVAEVLVAVGQTVANGDKVLIVEAMKMKTPMVAHRAGRIAAIAVTAGQSVEPGQMLASIE